MRDFKISFFKHRVSYYQCSVLKLFDFYVYPYFYFTYAKKYGVWCRIRIFGKWCMAHKKFKTK